MTTVIGVYLAPEHRDHSHEVPFASIHCTDPGDLDGAPVTHTKFLKMAMLLQVTKIQLLLVWVYYGMYAA